MNELRRALIPWGDSDIERANLIVKEAGLDPYAAAGYVCDKMAAVKRVSVFAELGLLLPDLILVICEYACLQAGVHKMFKYVADYYDGYFHTAPEDARDMLLAVDADKRNAAWHWVYKEAVGEEYKEANDVGG